MSELGKYSPQHRGGLDAGDTDSVDITPENLRSTSNESHRCQPSRNRAGNPANLVVSRIPAFFPKHPAFLGFFGGEKNRRNSRSFLHPKRYFVLNFSFKIKDFRLYDENSSWKGRTPVAHTSRTSRACVAAPFVFARVC